MLWHGKNFRGFINKAKEMIFDNTGTDLVSTNAEDAIKEVNSNLEHETISIPIQNGDTWKTLFNRVYSTIDTSKVTLWSMFIISGTIIFKVDSVSNLYFVRVAGSPTGVFAATARLQNGTSTYTISTGSTRNDISNESVDSAYIGNNIVFYYK